MKSRLFALSLMLLPATAGFGQTTNYPKAKVSFDDFKGLVAQVIVLPKNWTSGLDGALQGKLIQ